jgi:hypothetical protein
MKKAKRPKIIADEAQPTSDGVNTPLLLDFGSVGLYIY